MDKKAAYKACRRIARKHYENFPVVSWLTDKHLRDEVAAIYAFARTADDIADEGSRSQEERLHELSQFEAKLTALLHANPVEEPIFIALADTISKHQLPIEPFYALLSAFVQDVTHNRYPDFHAIKDYCKRSAEPIGQLMLHLNQQSEAKLIAESNAVCTALQLINFLQDIYPDYKKRNRIYLPLDEMETFGLNEKNLFDESQKPQVEALISRQIQRIRALLNQGKGLKEQLTGRMRIQITMTIQLGEHLLDTLSKRGGNIKIRPKVGTFVYLKFFLKALSAVLFKS